MQQLFVNTNAQSPVTALARNELVPVPAPPPWWTIGDQVPFQVLLVDGSGGYDARSASVDYVASLILGNPGEAALAIAFSMIASGNGWFGVIDLDEPAIATAMGSEVELNSYLRYQLIEVATSYAQTFLQTPVKILNKISTP